MSNADLTLETQKKDPQRWLMLFFVCLLFFMINGFVFQTFNLLLRTIAVDLGWSAAERAYVATGLSTGMIWFVFISGMAMDKFNLKRMLGSFLVFAGIFVIFRGYTYNATAYFILMFVYGMAISFIVPSLTKIVSLWFDSHDLALANGILTASSPIGQIAGNMLTIPLSKALGGWNLVFTCQGGLLIAIAIAFLIFAKNKKNLEAALSSALIKSEADLGLWKNIKGISKSPLVWLFIISNAFMMGQIYAGGSQGQVVLQGDPKWMLDKSISGIIPSCTNLACAFSYIIVPWLYAKYFTKKSYERNYKIAAVVCGLVCPFALSSAYMSYDFTRACILMAIAGVCYGAIVPASKVLLLKLPEVSGARAGTALGAMTTLERIAQSIFTGIVGGYMAIYPDRMAEMVGKSYYLLAVPPLLILVSLILEVKKEPSSKQTA